jgi:hypothetical protein
MNPNAAHLVSIISAAENRLSALFYLVGGGDFAGQYVLVSSARVAKNQHEETCIFIADALGEPKDWVALYRRFDCDQDEALKGFGYPVNGT